tara:strand:+ start:248 stop:382 length:135 start_codon:yes stop_codon:yes gene_type:complete
MNNRLDIFEIDDKWSVDKYRHNNPIGCPVHILSKEKVKEDEVEN